ncbi:MAG: DUF6261 family protein [Tannerella sp.]|jgi:hypothetical protein|nr:DUF6261 family protein [Tannerella sp.]
MVKFKALVFKNLPNAAHFNFCSQASEKILTAGEDVITALGTLPSQFVQWLTKETALMEWVNKSQLTVFIAEADSRMDRALISLKAQVHAHTFSSDQKIVKAAQHVDIMLKSYGKVYSKPYEEQTGDVRAILLQFTGEYAEDAAMLPGVPACISELQGAFTVFRELLQQRDTHSLLKPAEGFPAVRRGIEGVYRQIVTVVDAGVVLNVSPDFALLINSLNPEIERLNAEYHRAKRNIADAEPAPIPQQAYTGQPVTPMLEVLYVTSHDGTVKLQLGKDYNLSYRNNVDVGNAECTIHGKGHYMGSKTVTFIITRI